MDYLFSIIFGIIQGITEFLPVSSSGHLVLLHKFISLPLKNEIAFDVVLHLATLFAVLWFFKKDIISIIKSFLLNFTDKKNSESRIGWMIIISAIPAGFVGYFFENIIEKYFRSVLFVAIMLVLVGILFIVMEKISKFNKDYKNLKYSQAFMIGVAQCLALIPGTSRSGITIIAGLSLGLKREQAVRFSFLMSLPIIFGASVKKIPELFNSGLQSNELIILFIAFLFSFLSGIITIKYFLRFAQNKKLNIFAYYRFILAMLIIYYFIIN